MKKWISIMMTLLLVLSGVLPVFADTGYDLELDDMDKTYVQGDVISLSGTVKKGNKPVVADILTGTMSDSEGNLNGIFDAQLGFDGQFEISMAIPMTHAPGRSKIDFSVQNQKIGSLVIQVEKNWGDQNNGAELDAEIVHKGQETLGFTYQSENANTNIIVRVMHGDQMMATETFLTDENGKLAAEIAIGSDWKHGIYTLEFHEGTDGKVTKEVIEYMVFEKIRISGSRGSLKKGDSLLIHITAKAIDGKRFSKIPFDGISLTSSKSDVASVTENGKVKAVSEGIAVITAKVGTLTDSFRVRVIGVDEDKDDSGQKPKPPHQPSNPSNGNTTLPGGDDDSKDDQIDKEDDKDPVDPKRPVNVDDDYTSETRDKVKKAAKNLDKKTAKEAKKEVAELAKAVRKEMREAGLNAHEAKQIAQEIADTANVLLEKDDLTVEDATEVVQSILVDNIAQAAAMDEERSNVRALQKNVEGLTKKLIRKAGTIKAEAAVEKADDQTVLTYPEEAVQAAIQQAIDVQKKLMTSMTENGLAEIASVQPELVMEVPESVAGEKLAVSLQETVLASLKEANADVLIKGAGFQFGMPTDVLKAQADKTEILVVAKPVTTADQPAATTPATESDEKLKVAGPMFDLDVLTKDATGSKKVESFAKLPTVSFDIPESATDTGRLGIYVLNEESGKWEQIRSKIVDGQIVCQAPHFSLYAVMEKEVSIQDVQNHWAKGTIEMMTAQGVVPKDMLSGDALKQIMPDQKITRAEFAALLVNMLELEADVHSNFTDVPEDAWYYDGVAIAAMNGLVSGVGNGRFAPEAEITRQDMCVMISKAYKLAYNVDMTGASLAFTDASEVRDYAITPVNAARYQQIVSGYGDGSFKPFNNATRAEAIQMVKALMEQ